MECKPVNLKNKNTANWWERVNKSRKKWLEGTK